MKGRRGIREAAVAEYMAGDVSYRQLEARYRVSSSTLHRWVEEYKRGKWAVTGAEKEVIERVAGRLAGGGEEMPSDMKLLRTELHEARLKNKLLEAMIDIAEEQMGVSIRKKRGAKR
jgi:transposase-like protein